MIPVLPQNPKTPKPQNPKRFFFEEVKINNISVHFYAYGKPVFPDMIMIFFFSDFLPGLRILSVMSQLLPVLLFFLPT